MNNNFQEKIVCIAFATGCPRSQMENVRVQRYFAANKWKITYSIPEAELVIVSTCGVNNYSEEKSFNLLKITRKQMRSTALLVVCGCLPAMSEKQLQENFNAVCIPSQNLAQLDGIIDANIPFVNTPQPNEIKTDLEKSRSCYSLLDRIKSRQLTSLPFRINTIGSSLKALLKFPWLTHDQEMFNIHCGSGCLGDCSYCGIRLSAGKLKSRPSEHIITDFQTGLAKGYKRFRFISGDVGAYGQDIKTNILNLLERILDESGDYRLILIDFNVNWLIRYQGKLIDLLSSNMQHIEELSIPVQSASNSILQQMRRPYNAEAATIAMGTLREKCPSMRLLTHIMVGFPGESEEDFGLTLEFLKKIRFNVIDVYRYADRPKTEAANLPGKITEKDKNERIRRLKKMFPETCHIVV